MRTTLQTLAISTPAFILVTLTILVARQSAYTRNKLAQTALQTKTERFLPQGDVHDFHSNPDGPYPAKDLAPRNPEHIKIFESIAKPEVTQDDPELIHFLRNAVIERPRPYAFKFNQKGPLYKTPQLKEVVKIFKERSPGRFFVEAGANDGWRSSNTIWLERNWGWKGFLVEMDTSFYLQLRGRNRQCYTANACVSPKNYSYEATIEESSGGRGVIRNDTRGANRKLISSAWCFPLYSMMLALNQTHIDYFSLDVEGLELEVLQTIPFDKLDISVLSVEYLHADKKALKKFMESMGYETRATLAFEKASITQYSYDYIFVKSGLKI